MRTCSSRHAKGETPAMSKGLTKSSVACAHIQAWLSSRAALTYIVNMAGRVQEPLLGHRSPLPRVHQRRLPERLQTPSGCCEPRPPEAYKRLLTSVRCTNAHALTWTYCRQLWDADVLLGIQTVRSWFASSMHSCAGEDWHSAPAQVPRTRH